MLAQAAVPGKSTCELLFYNTVALIQYFEVIIESST